MSKKGLKKEKARLMRVIKIVLLTDCLGDPDAGGAERKIYELAARLDKKRFHVTLASLECEAPAAHDIVQKNNCSLAVFKVKRIYGLSGLVEGIKFRHFLKKEKTDILVTYHFSSDIWGTFWARFAGVKNIVSNRRDMGFWRTARHIKAYRFINRWVKKIIVVADAVKGVVIAEEAVPGNKIDVIYNGVNLNSSAPLVDAQKLRASLAIAASDIALIHVANFKKVKGHVYLLEAFSGLRERFPNIKLLLVGEDEFNGELQQKAKQLSIDDSVLFLGKRNDVQSLLQVADICVLPSLSEGMSNAGLEYMAAGKPVVATNVGGNPEIIEGGVTGILVPPKDTAALREALARLIADPQSRRKMGNAGRERVEHVFDLTKMVKKYQQLFLNLLEAGS
jgi:glycosyltransferase involved in cell wall biosynthesis